MSMRMVLNSRKVLCPSNGAEWGNILGQNPVADISVLAISFEQILEKDRPEVPGEEPPDGYKHSGRPVHIKIATFVTVGEIGDGKDAQPRKEHLSRYGICERSEGGHLDGQNIKKWFIEMFTLVVVCFIATASAGYLTYDGYVGYGPSGLYGNFYGWPVGRIWTYGTFIKHGYGGLAFYRKPIFRSYGLYG